MFKKMEKVWDIIGEILAIVLVLVYAVMILNATFEFIPAGSLLLNILEVVRTYGAFLLVAVVGLEAMSKRKPIFVILFLALIALIVVFMFFPDTYSNFINIVAPAGK